MELSTVLPGVTKRFLALLLILSSCVPAYGSLSGELRKWHKITLGFEGPQTSETASLNPFTDYRLDVTFTHQVTGTTRTIPGYYACDGNAANSGATSGKIWLAHYAPDQVGTWKWQVSFTTGSNVAQNGGGSSAGFFDNASGSFDVIKTNKVGRDHRGKGLLQYVGEHHLQFAETKEWFVKAGADSPENFLAYEDFDNTPNFNELRKTWAPHIQDYRTGNPSWAGGKGKGIIGAINYLAEKGMNAFSFLTMNIEGDDQNIFPYISDSPGNDRLRIDVSKMAQWEVLFEHADTMGLNLHFKTQEIENSQLLDGGALGNERKLYYRELVARFSHHLALTWNIGEENTNTVEERKAFADYIKQIDSYQHHVVIHNNFKAHQATYAPLLGYPTYDGVSLQSSPSTIFNDTLEWRTRSADAGHKWVVANDEQNPSKDGVKPDANDPAHDVIRQDVLWANIMAGGAGVEYYFGYSFDNSDLTCQDFRSRSNMWDQSRYALEFFSKFDVPFWDMENANARVSDGNWCLAHPDDKALVVYLKKGGATLINLSGDKSTSYTVQWYDPRNGGDLMSGSSSNVTGGSNRNLGNAPTAVANKDWVVLIRHVNGPSPTGSRATDAPTPKPTAAPTPRPTAKPTAYSPTALVGVVGFTLVNARDSTDIYPFKGEDIIDLSSVGTMLSVRADTAGSQVKSVVFDMDTTLNIRTENLAPYALNGDANGVYMSVSRLTLVGKHTIWATAYSDVNGGGEKVGNRQSIVFTVVESVAGLTPPPTPRPTPPPVAGPTPPPTPRPTQPPVAGPTPPPTPRPTDKPPAMLLQQGVIGFTLIDANTEKDVRVLIDGDTIDLEKDGSVLTIRADTVGSAVNSVVFDFDGSSGVRIENVAPYGLAGDLNGDHYPFNKLRDLGTHSISATAFSQRDGNGTPVGTAHTIVILVIQGGALR